VVCLHLVWADRITCLDSRKSELTLKEQYGRDVSPEQATADYARQYAQKSRLHSAQQAFRHMADRLRTFLTYKPRSMLARAAAH
jgi:hypothetical protein